MSRSIVESLVGALILALALFSIYTAVRSSDVRQTGGYEVNASFGNAAGLTSGTDVRLAGVKVGTVSAQQIDPETFRAKVVLSLDQEVRLPIDSTIRIVPDGLLGGTYVALRPGGSKEIAEPGASFDNTGDSLNVVELVTRIVTLAVDATGKSDETQGSEPEAGEDSGLGLGLGLE